MRGADAVEAASRGYVSLVESDVSVESVGVEEKKRLGSTRTVTVIRKRDKTLRLVEYVGRVGSGCA